MAADELFVTASAVSHRIKSLEDYLGRKLFKRNKRKVVLTPTGQKYLVSISRALNEIEVASQVIIANPKTDILTLSSSPKFLTRWLMPRLHRFQSLYPDIEMHISSNTEMIDFNKSNIDMAIYFGHGDWHDIEVKFLRKVFLVPVYSPSLLTAEHPLKTPQDLRNYNLIHVSRNLYEWPEWLQLSGIEYTGFKRGLQLSSSELAMVAAEEGLGVVLAVNSLCARDIKNKKLIKPFDILLDTGRAYYLVHQKGQPLSYGMQVFKEWLLKEMKVSPD
jgi:LysR family glycine cleavage system transcriptional activator